MYNFSKCEMMVSKYGYLMLPGAFPVKVISDTDFKDDLVVQCVVPIVKILMQVAGNLQIVTNKFSGGYLWHGGLTYYFFWTQFCA